MILEKRTIAWRLATPSPASLEIAPGLWAVRVLSVLEAAAFVQLAERAPFWSPAVINSDAAVEPAIRVADVLPEEALGAHGTAYRDRLAWATADLGNAHAPGSKLHELQIVRYGVGGKYVDHRDVPPEGSVPRSLSIVLYLNEACDGGETVFPELDVSVQPMTGIAIAFSPELLHRADPLMRGTKHAITAWYHRIADAGVAC